MWPYRALCSFCNGNTFKLSSPLSSVSHLGERQRLSRAMRTNRSITIDSVVAILIIAATALAFVVLYNLSNINISERKREIATLKVLGFYPKEVDKYINSETFILTTIGIIIGLIFGSYLSHFIISTCEPDYIMFDRNVFAISYIYSILITTTFTIIVNIVTHFNLKKINMIESLKNVE